MRVVGDCAEAPGHGRVDHVLIAAECRHTKAQIVIAKVLYLWANVSIRSMFIECADKRTRVSLGLHNKRVSFPSGWAFS